MNEKTRRIALMGMLSAMAYVVMLVGRIPIVLFLKYDPKDVIIAIGSFLLGPVSGAIISVLVSLVEMFTASDTGIIGFFMNVLSTCAFVVPAGLIYSKRRTIRNAVIGLAVGVVCMTAVMLAWNYIITPIYMGYPRSTVAEMLIPVFLPFNLFKGILNAGITMLIYKPVARALRRAHMIPAETTQAAPVNTKKRSLTVTLVSIFVIATAIVCFWLLSRS